MKDFYKILGVKETASEEEIRARWVELTKHYHPDRGEDIASNEKIREINEAYQILKHSSTRVEYDLKRTYGQRKREGGKGFYFKKLGVPASILIIFIILGVIYFNRFQTTSVSELTASDQINQTNQRNETNQRNQIDQIDQKNPIHTTTQKPSVAPKPQRITTLTKPQQRIDVLTQQPQLATSTPAVPITINQRNQTDQTNLKIDLAQFKPPSLLATEDEVRNFFSNYIERYNRMDIEGFLSFFSLKAIQNEKDGLEGIRKIYTDFFNQGQGVRYNMQDMKIEIYQNAVEVKARYEIEQISKMGGEKKAWRGNVRWVLGKENGVLKIISLDYQHQKSV